MLNYLLSPEGFLLTFLLVICGITVSYGVFHAVKRDLLSDDKSTE